MSCDSFMVSQATSNGGRRKVGVSSCTSFFVCFIIQKGMMHYEYFNSRIGCRDNNS